jgi:hypothetical protein
LRGQAVYGVASHSGMEGDRLHRMCAPSRGGLLISLIYGKNNIIPIPYLTDFPGEARMDIEGRFRKRTIKGYGND